MDRHVSKGTRAELIEALGVRYREATKRQKTRILDEFVAVAGCHRKHAIRMLGGRADTAPKSERTGRRIYDEAVREVLILVWEAADRICGKRLKAALPSLVEAMERHGHLALDPLVRERVLSASAATIDRLLKPVRESAGRHRKRRRRRTLSKQIAVRTFAEWNEPVPGYLEIDFVAHCGGMLTGAFIHSLVATDVCSGWTEAVPLLVREQSLVVEGLDVIGKRLPVAILGIDSDNDSAFINESVLTYCARRQIDFTRSRAYHKNDQAWIEQKNGAIVRRFVGYERFTGRIAGQALSHLYGKVRLYVNYFQPSFKLLEKTRDGAKVSKRYARPATPCDRLLGHDAVSAEAKEALREQRAELDPVELLHGIRNAQAALAALVSPELGVGPQRQSLEQFLSQLPTMWRVGEVRPTHATRPVKPRTWRTRKDPFEGVWSNVLIALQQDPDMTAKTIFERLQSDNPGRFTNGQLRTLQRRVKEWRAIMARELIYATLNSNIDRTAVQPIGIEGLDRPEATSHVVT
jgi:hypothetical protein